MISHIRFVLFDLLPEPSLIVGIAVIRAGVGLGLFLQGVPVGAIVGTREGASEGLRVEAEKLGGALGF